MSQYNDSSQLWMLKDNWYYLLVTIADAFGTFIPVPREALHAWTEIAHLFA